MFYIESQKFFELEKLKMCSVVDRSMVERKD